MRDVTNIQLDAAIVHLLDAPDLEGCVFSERPVPLAPDSPLQAYFVDHIANSLRDPAAKAASFTDLTDEGAASTCISLLSDSANLVRCSRHLAESLHALMVKDRRIKRGNLAVCIYRAENHPEVPHYLALLKIDSAEGYRPKQEHDAQGRLYVSFEIESNLLPTPREKLQKCVFVQPLNPRPEYDMILLDRQMGQPDAVAKFFSKAFLGAHQTFDARQRTDLLYDAALDAYHQLEPTLSEEDRRVLRQAIDVAVAGDAIQLDSWIESLPLPPDKREVVDRAIRRRLPDREFAIDPGIAERLRRKRHFRGPHELRVEILSDYYDQTVRVHPPDPAAQPGRPPRWRIEIETEDWVEVKK